MMIQSTPFKINDIFQSSWKLTKEHFFFFLVYQLVLYALLFFTINMHDQWEWSISSLISWLLIILVKMGLFHSALVIIEDKKPTYYELYQHWSLLYSWIAASFVFGVLFAFAFTLLILPALYVLATFGLYPFFILDKQNGPFESLKQSLAVTKGYRWQILFLFLVCIGLNLLGLLLFGIGMLVTTPLTVIALALAYRKLTSHFIQPPKIYSKKY